MIDRQRCEGIRYCPIVASFSARDVPADVIAILHRRAIAAGWMSRVVAERFEIYLPK
jgi:hypothetical protein